MRNPRHFQIIMAVLVLAAIIPFVGCTEDPDKLAKATNALYLDIKTVVTDPEVRPLISENNMERLAVLELVYLQAARAIKTGEAGATPLAGIVGCADEVLEIINSLVLDGRYDKEFAAIRISLKILRNHIQLE